MPNIRLSFRGTDYVIPEGKVFEVGEAIEEIATIGEIASWGKSPKFHKLARCFGEMLRYAGCKISDREVFSDIMAQIKAAGDEIEDPDKAKELVAVQAVHSLIAVLMDGAPESDGEGDGGKPSAS